MCLREEAQRGDLLPGGRSIYVSFMNQGKLLTMKHISTSDTNFIQVCHSLPGKAVYRLLYKLNIMSIMHMWDYCIGESDVNMFF